MFVMGQIGRLMACAASLASLLAVGGALAAGVAGEAAAGTKVTPNLTVFNGQQSLDGGKTVAEQRQAPTVLRGSATRRGTKVQAYDAAPDPGRWQISTGETLWLTDPASGEIIACKVKRTSRVGQRVIRCVEDELNLR